MHVICNIPNAGPVMSINGVDKKFVPIEWNGRSYRRVSEDLTEEEGERLLKIPGFELFRGDAEAVAEAVERFERAHIEEVQASDTHKDREIAELQKSCVALRESLSLAKRTLQERDEEVAHLREMIGEPSLRWTRDQLAAFAESIGLVVNEAQSKHDLLDAVSARLAQKG